MNLGLFFLYLYPGSFLGLLLYKNKNLQPQITEDFVISTNHFYVFFIISVIGLLTYKKTKQIKFLKIYLILISILLEISHLIIPLRTFQWSDLFGNLIGVIIVILLNNLINKYDLFKK
tara:strand:+ start:485 stop:838 length:354 start_codon:yes stop_codon:yes gene_type:complete